MNRTCRSPRADGPVRGDLGGQLGRDRGRVVVAGVVEGHRSRQHRRHVPVTGRQREAPGHIAPRKLDRGKPAFLADKATGVLVDGSGFGSAFCSHLLSEALARSPGHCVDLGQDAFLQIAAFRKHSWGSRGRRFKSGRPDW